MKNYVVMSQSQNDDQKFSGYRPIVKLPQEVSDRIAAGETILYPRSVVKELIENSLDAGATEIEIVITRGGLDLVMVRDNGHGIQADDMHLLCQRSATSKLIQYEDLKTLDTLGFRGEALGSMSNCAHVSARSMTPDARFMTSAKYKHGQLIGQPESIAGTPGTVITVENVFYNMPIREKAIRPFNEYTKIIEIVSKFALRYPHCSFFLRRTDSRDGKRGSPDVRTNGGATVMDNIRAVYGMEIAKTLFNFQLNMSSLNVQVNAWAIKPSLALRNITFILFINGRLVECESLKRAVSAAYRPFLRPRDHPWTYFDLTMNTHDVDINIHPTKREVCFLHSEEIIDAIVEKLIAELKPDEDSNTLVQSCLINTGPDSYVPGQSQGESQTGGTLTLVRSKDREDLRQREIRSAQRPHRKLLPKDKVRTGSKTPVDLYHVYLSSKNELAAALSVKAFRKRRPDAGPLLTSVEHMLAKAKEDADEEITTQLREHVYIGYHGPYVFLQHNTKLLLLVINPFFKELIYQQTLIRFSDHQTFKLNPPAPVKAAIQSFLRQKSGPVESSLDEESCTSILLGKSELLGQYYGIVITGESGEDARLDQLPLILPEIFPDMRHLGWFLYEIATNTNWDEEYAGLQSIAQVVAKWYAEHSLSVPSSFRGRRTGDGEDAAQFRPREGARTRKAWILKHIMLTAMRKRFHPPRSLKDTAIFELTTSGELYKMFERC